MGGPVSGYDNSSWMAKDFARINRLELVWTYDAQLCLFLHDGFPCSTGQRDYDVCSIVNWSDGPQRVRPA